MDFLGYWTNGRRGMRGNGGGAVFFVNGDVYEVLCVSGI